MRRGFFIGGRKIDVQRWLDDYEVELALRDQKEIPPEEIWRAWYQKAMSGKPASWYWDAERDD